MGLKKRHGNGGRKSAPNIRICLKMLKLLFFVIFPSVEGNVFKVVNHMLICALLF